MHQYHGSLQCVHNTTKHNELNDYDPRPVNFVIKSIVKGTSISGYGISPT